MSLNPTPSGDSNSWNYSNPDNPGFSLKLTGTVVAIQEVQATKFGTQLPDYWDDGNPKMNIRLVLVGPKGGIRTWTITPAGKEAKAGRKPSVHIDLYNLAGPGGHQFTDLIGKTITSETQAPPPGFGYGSGSPRPWTVSLAAEGPYSASEPLDPIYLLPKVYHNTAVSGGSMTPQVSAGAAAAAMGAPAAMAEAQAAAAAAAAAAAQPVASDEPKEEIPF